MILDSQNPHPETAVGARLRQLRQQHGLTQRQLATWLGVSHATIAHWETGTMRMGPRSVTKLATFFGVRAAWLAWGEEPAQDRADPAAPWPAARLQAEWGITLNALPADWPPAFQRYVTHAVRFGLEPSAAHFTALVDTARALGTEASWPPTLTTPDPLRPAPAATAAGASGPLRFARVATAPDARLPQRATAGSAGYDVYPYIAEPLTIAPGAIALIRTGIKAYMPRGWVLLLMVRSSVGIKRRLVIPNSVGVIDADYADNPENEGEIFLALWNIGSEPQTIQPTDRLAQGLFVPHGVTADDAAAAGRGGGIGSTDR